MKFNQLLSPALIVAALLVIAVLCGFGQKFLSAGSVQNSKDTPNQDAKQKPQETNSRQPVVGNAVQASNKNQDDNAENSKTRELLQKSVILLRNKSFRAAIRQRGMLFGTELIANGSYLHADGGKGGVKTQLELQTQNLILKVEMVNDGVYFFKQVKPVDEDVDSAIESKTINTQAQPNVERINLRDIRERVTGDVSWPGHWIAFGGLYHFVDQARRSFEFGPVRQKKIKGNTYDVIKGTWKPEKLASLIPTQKESIINRRAINWQRVPQQIPLEVEIIFINQGELEGFPFRIVFYRPNVELLEGFRNSPVLITEYSNPEIIETPLQSDFQFNAAENEVVDITEEFLNSLKR